MPKRDSEDTDREVRIRQRAFAIWEAEGMPPGRDVDHWIAAEREESSEENQSPSLGTPLVEGAAIPDIRAADPGGLTDEQRDPTRADGNEAPTVPKTSGAARPAPDTSKSRVANRDTEGPRKAGATPRPTRKPISGTGAK
jgi:hypothetical protein